MLTYIPVLEHSWNTRPSYLHGAGHLCTQEKDVFFSNALKVSLAPNPQERPFHVMFVIYQHTQEPKETQKMCDWNHLLSSVAVPTKPISRHDRHRTLTQLDQALFLFHRSPL